MSFNKTKTSYLQLCIYILWNVGRRMRENEKDEGKHAGESEKMRKLGEINDNEKKVEQQQRSNRDARFNRKPIMFYSN